MDVLLIQLLVPFFGAIICYLFKSRASGLVASFFALMTFSLTLFNILTSLSFTQKTDYQWDFFSWLNIPFSFGLFTDGLSSLMLILITLIGLFVILYSVGYLSPNNRDHGFYPPYGSYYFLMLLFIGAMIGVVTSKNFLQVFLFWEITTICSWALISYMRDSKGIFSGFKAFIMTHIGGISFLVALGILYVEAKSFDFSSISVLPPTEKFLVFGLLFFAASAKSAQIPLFTWLPNAMVAPTPVSAYLHAAAMVKAGVYLIARIYLSNPELSANCAFIVAVVSILTMLISVILYYIQDDLKSLLAYSTIGHLGYILFGVSLGIFGSITGGIGGIFHIINHGFAKGLLFLCVGAISYATGSKSINELRGISSKFPFLAVCFIVGMFSIVGIPPFSGFWSKFMIFTGAFELKYGPLTFFGILAIFESLLSFCWYIFVGHRVFFGTPSEKVLNAHKDLPFSMRISLVLLLFFTIISPLLGYPFVKVLYGGV